MNKQKELFIKSLNEYVLGRITNDMFTKNLDKLNYNHYSDKLLIENEDPLYRGVYFSEKDELVEFLKIFKPEGFVEKNITSWTESNIIGMNFMYGTGYGHYNKIESRNLDGYNLLLTCIPEDEDIIFSYKDIDRCIEDKYPKLKELMDGDSECLLRSGLYKIEISHASENCRETINSILENRIDFNKWIEYIA